MKENDNSQAVAQPNWAHHMACSAFIAPVSVAVVGMYHDSMSLSSGLPWQYLKLSFMIHSIVIVVSILALIIMAIRWREFYKLPRARQWLVTLGCWIILIEAFAFCMMMT